MTGDSGSFIGYCGAVYTRPELQPDGSLLFWQIELTIESEDLCRLGRGQDVHAGHCPRGPGAPGAHRRRLARGGSERAGVSPACNTKPQPVLRRQNGLRV